MQTSWDVRYVERKYGTVHRFLKDKRIEFERKTGAKWTYYYARGRYQFHPTWTFRTPPVEDMELALDLFERFESGPRNAVPFLEAAEKTGVALPHLIGVIKWLCQHSHATAVVGRSGQAAAFYTRREYALKRRSDVRELDQDR